MNNWKFIAGFIGVFAVYEILVFLMWLGLKWMISPFVPTKVKLAIGIALFIVANFSIVAYMLRLGAPWVNYGNVWYFYFLNGAVIGVILLVAKLLLKILKLNLSQGISLSITALYLLGMTALGLFWAYSPTVINKTIKVDKHLDTPVKIAMVSDLHLGTFFSNPQLEKLNKIVDEEKPDAVVIAGDLMDDDMIMYKKRNMQENLSKLKAPLGVYTTMGNHDRDALEIVNEVKKTGIIPLFDESITLNNDVTLVGRKDKSVSRDRLDTLPIDVQLSGHTHRGQLWPLNFITDVVYTLDHGYAKINGKHFFTSAGYGFWGPPFKTSARSEVWMITIEGK